MAGIINAQHIVEPVQWAPSSWGNTPPRATVISAWTRRLLPGPRRRDRSTIGCDEISAFARNHPHTQEKDKKKRCRGELPACRVWWRETWGKRGNRVYIYIYIYRERESALQNSWTSPVLESWLTVDSDSHSWNRSNPAIFIYSHNMLVLQPIAWYNPDVSLAMRKQWTIKLWQGAACHKQSLHSKLETFSDVRCSAWPLTQKLLTCY